MGGFPEGRLRSAVRGEPRGNTSILSGARLRLFLLAWLFLPLWQPQSIRVNGAPISSATFDGELRMCAVPITGSYSGSKEDFLGMDVAVTVTAQG